MLPDVKLRKPSKPFVLLAMLVGFIGIAIRYISVPFWFVYGAVHSGKAPTKELLDRFYRAL